MTGPEPVVPAVAVLRWPEDGEEGDRLLAIGSPVLYLVDDAQAPPVTANCFQDWMRSSGGDEEVASRTAALAKRCTVHRAPPQLDEENRLHHLGHTIQLSEDEAALASPLVERLGQVVDDAELRSLHHADCSLTLSMRRLRSRLRETGLALQRARAGGYVLRRG